MTPTMTVPNRDVMPHEHKDAHFVCVLDAGYRSSAAGPLTCFKKNQRPISH